MLPYFAFEKFSLSSLTIYTWGLFAAIAFIIALIITLKEAKRKGINQDKLINLSIAIVAGGVIGARLFYVLQFPDYFFSHPGEILRLDSGGLAFYGGAIGAFVAGFAYIRYAKLNFWQIADAVAPSLAIGEFIGRIGCVLVNDHIGTVTALAWGQQYLDGSIRHPIAAYMSLNGLAMFLVLWSIRKKVFIPRLSKNCHSEGTSLRSSAGSARRISHECADFSHSREILRFAQNDINTNRIIGQSRVAKTPGMLFIIFLLWYSITRFFLDFLRCNDLDICDPHYWGLTPSQYTSVFIALTSLVVLWYLMSKVNKTSKHLNI